MNSETICDCTEPFAVGIRTDNMGNANEMAQVKGA